MAITYGVDLPAAEVIKAIVEAWRASRPETVKYWRELEDACYNAVDKAPAIYKYRNIKFAVRGKFLAIKLPSGRCLWYANPRLELKKTPWGQMKKVVAFDGVNSVTRKWTASNLYGGLIAENITQAVARDILVNGMFNVEAAGYPVVVHVHDEAVSEVPEGFGSVEEYEALLCTKPEWAEGLPLKAEGWRGFRYRK
jgi:DNA polymerase